MIGIKRSRQSAALDVEASLEELGLLADTAGLHVVGQTYQALTRPNSATYIGKGKLDEVKRWVTELNVGVALFDDELGPRHQRNLENEFGEQIKVLDRTALILDIFAQHARTREGALQVELAQYEYRLPRLTRQWTHLVRQAGGSAGRGGVGGVGLRGPGETQLESDRREIRRKIIALRADLETVRAQRGLYRSRRRASETPLVALVGYTNAGKSTLLNQLTGANARVADQLFATLDPTTRRAKIDQRREALITDTVGFVQKLPHALVAAFRATLEEIADANLLLHVIDGSHSSAVSQMKTVELILRNDLGIREIPIIRVVNKIDLPDWQYYRPMKGQFEAGGRCVFVSAKFGEGIDDLRAQVAASLFATYARVTVNIPYSEGRTLARFRRKAHVISESQDGDRATLTGILSHESLREFERHIVEKG